MADSASSSIRTNHWSARQGSIGVLLRSEWARSISRSSMSTTKPAASRSATTILRATDTVRPWYGRGLLIERAVGVEDIDHRQATSFADVVVVGIVGGRDLHAAASQLRLGPRVGDQRDFPLEQWQQQLPPGEHHVAQLLELAQHFRRAGAGPPPAVPPRPPFLWRAPPRVAAGAPLRRGPGLRRFGMDGHRGVPQHRLGTRRGDRHVGRFTRTRVDHRILDVPEVFLDRFVKHFVVAHGRLQERVPVHESLAAVDTLPGTGRKMSGGRPVPGTFSSRVNRRRCQSQLQPIDLSCWMIRVS